MNRCLLIEDDLDDQEIFCMALADVDSNIGCIIANDAPEALSLLTADKVNVPDFIFVDINMPKMNGIDCLKEMKSMAHLDSTKILMLSTTSDQNLIDLCLRLGADGFIVKPASLVDLADKLSQAFSNDR